MTVEKPKIVVICGPTASGKSSLAMALATRFQAEIVNADSMQVYRGMDIGTAKPGPVERRLVPHHLLDLVDPDQPFHAALFRQAALPVVSEITARSHIPLLVGGTGLYIKALLGGLLACPALDPDLRRSLQQECDRYGPEALHARLCSLDPPAAEKIHPRDRIRTIRALEIIKLTGAPFSDQVKNHHFQDNPFHVLKICLHLERGRLYERINQRCLNMLAQGLLRETEGLLAKGYGSELKPLKSIGYRHMIRYLEGGLSWDQAVFDFQADTRRYAKRQITWFRSDPGMFWIHPDKKDDLIRTIDGFIEDV